MKKLSGDFKDIILLSLSIILTLFLYDIYMGYRMFGISLLGQGVSLQFYWKFLDICYEIEREGFYKAIGYYILIWTLLILPILSVALPLYYFISYKLLKRYSDQGFEKDRILSNDKKSIFIVLVLFLIVPQIYQATIFNYYKLTQHTYNCKNLIKMDKIISKE